MPQLQALHLISIDSGSTPGSPTCALRTFGPPVSRGCPSLATLTLPGFNSSDLLPHLGSFAALSTLRLPGASLTAADLPLLARHAPNLRELVARSIRKLPALFRSLRRLAAPPPKPEELCNALKVVRLRNLDGGAAGKAVTVYFADP
jgi:hypothetical protein